MKYLFLVLMALSVSVFAGGDKTNNPWQPADPNTVFIPAGFDEITCNLIASTTSGQTYLCDQSDKEYED